MKQFNLSVAFLLTISFWCFSSNLSAQKSYQNEKAEIYMKKYEQNQTNKPRMPSMIIVDCWYGNGELSIEFRDPEGECDITVTDTTTGFTVTDTFDSTLSYTIYNI